ncbi:hypothetical protein SDJN02_25828 [Cucurbita argyrosperma subsp. argyrosperma]|nr:hypothetical protein SDJN02_25828 [Cucurbita argyrosperma subsp. argyrosperma]
MCLATLPEPFRESLSSLDAVGSDDSHLVCYGSRSDLVSLQHIIVSLVILMNFAPEFWKWLFSTEQR